MPLYELIGGWLVSSFLGYSFDKIMKIFILEQFQGSNYKPVVRSPHNLGLISTHKFLTQRGFRRFSIVNLPLVKKFPLIPR